MLFEKNLFTKYIINTPFPYHSMYQPSTSALGLILEPWANTGCDMEMICIILYIFTLHEHHLNVLRLYTKSFYDHFHIKKIVHFLSFIILFTCMYLFIFSGKSLFFNILKLNSKISVSNPLFSVKPWYIRTL